MNIIGLLLASMLMGGCVGLDPKNEGFADNATEVARRTLVGVMTLGISEGVLADERKRERIRARQEANYQRWYDNLSDQEKNIEDMKEAHRYQLMGTIMHGRQFPTMQLPTPPAYTIPQVNVPAAVRHEPIRQQTNCISSVIGDMISTNCY